MTWNKKINNSAKKQRPDFESPQIYQGMFRTRARSKNVVNARTHACTHTIIFLQDKIIKKCPYKMTIILDEVRLVVRMVDFSTKLDLLVQIIEI